MKKSIVNIEGVQKLNRNQQAKIKASSNADCCAANGAASDSTNVLAAIVDWVCGC